MQSAMTNFDYHFLVSFFWLIISYYSGYYEVYRYSKGIEIFGKLLKQFTFISLITFAYVGVKYQYISVDQVVIYIFWSFLLVGFIKFSIFFLLKKYRILYGGNHRNVIIVGNGKSVDELREFFTTNPDYGYNLVHIFDLKSNKKQELLDSKTYVVDNKIDESLEFTRYQADPNSSKDRLMVPPDLPGAQEPPIKLPKFTKENMAQRKEILAKLYPPLPVMAPEPVLASGPDGKPYSLSDLQKIALTSSPKIKQAVAAVAAARGSAIQAGLYPNPDFGYEGDTMQTNGTAGYQGGYIQQTIVTASKLPTARQAALMDVRITELSLRKAETDLSREVRNGYFAVLVADQVVKST